MKITLANNLITANAAARAISFNGRDRSLYFYPNQNWYSPGAEGSYLWERDGARSLDARTGMFYIATGVTPAMFVKMVGAGSQYAIAALDADKNYHNGGKTYKLHLPPNVPVKTFWSVVVYDPQTRSELQTDSRFPSIGSQSAAIEKNSGGSYDVYFGPAAPAGKEKNWIQTVPGKGFLVIIRYLTHDRVCAKFLVMDSKERPVLTTKPSMTFAQMKKAFATEEACKELLVQLRWPDGVKCPRCNNPKPYKLNFKPFHWQCRLCQKNGYRFSVLTKTVFENTNYPLKTWFEVMYLMCQSKKGMSALQIHRMIGSGSYETAWYMCQRIRAAMQDSDFPKLMGKVEADETFIGGKDRNRHKGKKSADLRRAGKATRYAKVGVIGAIERKGNVVCRIIGGTDAPTLSSFVNKVTSDKVELVATDENQAYNYVRRGLPHQAVNHSQDEWVRGEVHTNNIESFWSLLKRGVVGTYHNVSKKYLPLYLNEFSFRFNNRKNPDIFFDLIAGC